MVKQNAFQRFMTKALGIKLAEQGETRTVVVHTKQIGSTGTNSYAGYPGEDYLQELTGRQKADLFDKMARSDSQVIMCLGAISSPIQSAEWEIEPYDKNDPESVADAELMEFILFKGMRKSFNSFIGEALGVLKHGHAVFEMVDKIAYNHPEFGTINICDNLAFRSQRTIERWNLDAETNDLASVSQYAFGDLMKTVDIPAEFLLVMSIKKEGSNYEGISLLRGMYGNYFRKNNYMQLNAIGIEKFAVPTPIVEVPAGLEGSKEFESMIECLEKYQSHESNYLIHPTGYKITLTTNAYDPQKVESSIDNEDRRMVKSIMANFLELGMNGVGSHAQSFDLSTFFLNSIQFIADDIICEEINRCVIPRYIKMNRGERKGYPTLKATGISDKVGSALADMMQKYVSSNVITPDDDLEIHMRKRLGLPEMSDVGKRTQSAAAPTSAVPQLSERYGKNKRA